jgi:hypothetical protein
MDEDIVPDLHLVFQTRRNARSTCGTKPGMAARSSSSVIRA